MAPAEDGLEVVRGVVPDSGLFPPRQAELGRDRELGQNSRSFDAWSAIPSAFQFCPFSKAEKYTQAAASAAETTISVAFLRNSSSRRSASHSVTDALTDVMPVMEIGPANSKVWVGASQD